MQSFFSSALESVRFAASSKYALAAYALAIIGYVVIAWRVDRNRKLLRYLSCLPERDRIQAIRSEIGTILPNSVSPEEWLRARTQTFLSLCYLVTAALVATVAIIAIFYANGKFAIAEGDTIRVQQNIESVKGDVTGVKEPVARPPQKIEVDQNVGTVKGSVVGIDRAKETKPPK